MKAVYALLCLALARGITGSIFKQRWSHTDGLIVQPVEYIAKYQEQAYRDYHNKHRHHNSDSYSYESSQASKEQEDYQNQRRSEKNGKRKYGKHYADMSMHYSTAMKPDTETASAYADTIEWMGLHMAVGPDSLFENKQDIDRIFGDAQKTMEHLTAEDKAMFHKTVESVIQNDNEDVHLNATELLKKNEYPVEEYTVKTDDGYYLTLFRIPPKKQSPDGKAVMLMHGVLGSADDWLLLGPGKSLAYLLADAGHDVWLGNARGNKYSQRHASKHPALKDFWQFSIDEIANHDLPAMIDHALETSGQDKLHYIGHSQGNTVFFAMAAERPSYNDKIITMHALSPMVYMTNVRSPLLRMFAPTNNFYERLRQQLGHGAFEPTKEMIQTMGGALCDSEIGCQNVCSNVNFVMSGVNLDGLDVEMIPVILGHLPAGTSARVIKHYGQGVASHEFRKYDYGVETNKMVYGGPEPPTYELEKVQVPVSLYYSEGDWLAHPKDVEKLQKQLPNVKTAFKLTKKYFSQLDFQFSKDAPEVVYKQLIDSMQELPNMMI